MVIIQKTMNLGRKLGLWPRGKQLVTKWQALEAACGMVADV